MIVGLLIAAGLTTAVSEEALFSWAWRLPFLIALSLGLIGLYMRLRLKTRRLSGLSRSATRWRGRP